MCVSRFLLSSQIAPQLISHSKDIGSSLKTATAAAPPPHTRSARDPVPIPPARTVIRTSVTVETIIESPPPSKSTTTSSQLFAVALEVLGTENGAPVFAASEVLSSIQLKFPDAICIEGA